MGKSKPKAPKAAEYKPTAEEKELARQGVAKWNRYIGQYAPLEKDLIAASDRPTKNLQRGRGNADLMQEASQDSLRSLATPNVTTGLSNLGKMNTALSSAGSVNALQARLGDREYRDHQTLGAIQTGVGVAGSSQSALTTLGRQQNQLALDRFSTKYRADLEEDLANSQAINQLALLGGQAYFGNKARTAQEDRLAGLVHGGVYRNVDGRY